jgi:DNA-binding CsgD family transcriptional regulator
MRARLPAPRLDWGFARQCDRSHDLDDIRELLEIEFGRLGFRYFCCCSHVRPDRAPVGSVYLNNYPKAWLQHYMSNRLYERDPVYVIGREFALPFRWDDPSFVALFEPDQAAIMASAAEHGLKYGITIPLHAARGVSASCSVVGLGEEIDVASVFLAQGIAGYAYQAARRLAGPEPHPLIVLPRRERECLKLVALGKDDETIALILGLRRDTVRQYIESAKQRLGASKRPHAVAYALFTGAIAIEDLFSA